MIQRRTVWYAVAGVGAGLILGVLWSLFRPQTSDAPTINTATTNRGTNQTTTTPTNTAVGVTMFSTLDLPDRDPAFSFTADVPTAWAVEYVAASQAINVYDPRGAGETSLTNSKMFIKYFSAASFQTLTTVDILTRTELTINGRPAVTYTIKKKSSVPDFPDQPPWRNLEHRVTDIRSTDDSPTTFYVFAKAPEVSDATFDAFLNSLKFTTEVEASQVVYPLKDFLSRITKKRFGQYITPQNSPVSPERFLGYHTGVDAETTSDEQNLEVPVVAIATGIVTFSRTVDGYGGVVMIEHQVDGQTVTALYGHLDIDSVTLAVGATVTPGQTIGVLGAGGTSATSGERKHLHFGLLTGASANLRGYVSQTGDLTPWLDPLEWLNAHQVRDLTT